jgi:hypothetical protein
MASRGAVAAGCVTLAAAAALAAGCSQAIETPLPALGEITRDLLTAEEQRKAIEDLNQRKATHQADAIKAIEHEKAGAGSGSGEEMPPEPLTSRAQ